jgi:hypothetical protein
LRPLTGTAQTRAVNSGLVTVRKLVFGIATVRVTSTGTMRARKSVAGLCQCQVIAGGNLLNIYPHGLRTHMHARVKVLD